MDRNRQLSELVYFVDANHKLVTNGEQQKIVKNDIIANGNFLVLEFENNDKNSMQAMAVAEIKTDYLGKSQEELKKFLAIQIQ